MNKLQIGLLAALALLGGGVAYFFMHRTPQAKPPAIVAPILPPMSDQILIAKRDLGYGTALKETDFGWVETPKASVPKGAVTKAESPNAAEDLVGAFVRAPIVKGEPDSARSICQRRLHQHDVDPAVERDARRRH